MDNKICNKCGDDSWHRNGRCKTCQRNRAREIRNETQKDIDNGLYDEKVCDTCKGTGRGNWTNEKRCVNCRRISNRKTQEERVKKVKSGDYKYKNCQVCGGSDWNPSGSCRDCVKRRHNARKTIYTVEIIDGYWNGKRCSVCGNDSSWNNSGQCEKCAIKNATRRKEERKDAIANGLWENKDCDKCGDKNWGATGICKTCESIRGVKKRQVSYIKYDNGEYDNKICVQCGESNYSPDGRCRDCTNNRVRQWRFDNPELSKQRGREQKYKRIKRIVENGGEMMTIDLYNELLNFYGYTCINCGSIDDLCHDHVIPIVRGGDNSAYNAQILCNTCNVRKGTKSIDYRFDKGEHFKGR